MDIWYLVVFPFSNFYESRHHVEQLVNGYHLDSDVNSHEIPSYCYTNHIYLTLLPSISNMLNI